MASLSKKFPDPEPKGQTDRDAAVLPPKKSASSDAPTVVDVPDRQRGGVRTSVHLTTVIFASERARFWRP